MPEPLTLTDPDFLPGQCVDRRADRKHLSESVRYRLMRRVGRERPRGRGGNGTWSRARSEQRQHGPTSETKEWPWRSAEIIAPLCKVRNQFVSDVDFEGRLL